MLRSALLWASTNPKVAQRLPRMAFVQKASRRFMPGEAMEDALAATKTLNQRGAGTLITVLGEHVGTAEEAAQSADEYVRLLAQVRAQGSDAEASVKLSQLGLDLGVEHATRNLRTICAAAEGGLVWVDMEASEYVDRTLEVIRTLCEEGSNVGVCLQAYLRRTEKDLKDLAEFTPAIRLVKGAYMEPSDVAFAEKREVDAAFKKITTRLLREAHLGRMGRVALATHDPNMLGHAKSIAHELGLKGAAWEVDMLYGVGMAEQATLLRGDVKLRVLVSYGSAWFPWYMRRLAERPANVWFVLKQMVKG